VNTSAGSIDNHSHVWRNGGLFHQVRAVYVCICNGITDHDIRRAAEAGCSSVAELTMRTGAGACCGTCIDTAAAVLEDARASSVELVPLPLVARAA
jgi:bacterioferritin-associated ferredoxin